MQVDFDSVVVGAGVVGLAVARQLARTGRQVLVLEKAPRAGLETSSRNSEVIHAGIYYPTGSRKAELCLRGRGLLYDYCATHGVEAKRLGKLIVATSPEDELKLNAIAALAKANGVDDMQWLSASDVAAIEPEVRCLKALFSPSTGIVDAAGYMLSLQGDAETHGTSFAFKTSFESAARGDGHFVVTAKGEHGDITDVTCNALFNCAGHGAYDTAMRVEGFASGHLPPRYLAKGSYCSLSGPTPFKHLIYPVPVSGALGIHATLDMAGAARFGPDILWVDELDYGMPPGLPEKFKAAIAAYWPAVRDRELVPSYCGIRPKLHGQHEGFADFLVQSASTHGVSGLINFFGIESPGLTSSLAIAELAVQMLEQKAPTV